MSKNPQLDTSTEALAKSEEYLANATDSFLWALNNLNASHDEKMSLDSLVKVIQHYTFRVALNKQSVQIAKTLQNVYLGCSDPTGSKEFWRYAGEQRLTEQTV
jgi:hypothetical protein